MTNRIIYLHVGVNPYSDVPFLDAFAELIKVIPNPNQDCYTLCPLVADFRLIKSEDEIALISDVCSVAYNSIDSTLFLCDSTSTELLIANAVEKTIVESPGFELSRQIFVASGEHARFPKHAPEGLTPLKIGDLIVIDVGARRSGYCCNVCFTYVVGGFASPI